MENIKDVPMPEHWEHMSNLENYPSMLYQKLEKMEAMGLLDNRQVKEIKIMKEVGVNYGGYYISRGEQKCFNCEIEPQYWECGCVQIVTIKGLDKN